MSLPVCQTSHPYICICIRANYESSLYYETASKLVGIQPEYSLNTSTVQSQHFLGECCLNPRQLAFRKPARLHHHNLVQCVAKHRRLEYRLLHEKQWEKNAGNLSVTEKKTYQPDNAYASRYCVMQCYALITSHISYPISKLVHSSTPAFFKLYKPVNLTGVLLTNRNNSCFQQNYLPNTLHTFHITSIITHTKKKIEDK